MVLRYQGNPALDGPAAALLKSSADLTVESARMRASGLSSIGSGLETAAKSYAAGKQLKFENARETKRDTLDATYKQFEIDHGSAALLMENAAKYRQQAVKRVSTATRRATTLGCR